MKNKKIKINVELEPKEQEQREAAHAGMPPPFCYNPEIADAYLYRTGLSLFTQKLAKEQQMRDDINALKD